MGQLVNADTGIITAHYEYHPFGELVHSYGDYAGENGYRFSTKYWDEETGLYYYGYRYYSPQLGRWINRDPIMEKGGVNLFVFVNNNPINIWDFLGLEDLSLEEILWFVENNPYFEDPMNPNTPPEDPWSPNPPPQDPMHPVPYPPALDLLNDYYNEPSIYCRYGSNIISASLDTVSILSYTSVIGVKIGIAATALSGCNTLIKLKVCGSLSIADKVNAANTLITTINVVDVRVKIGTTIGDIAITLGEALLQ